MADGRRYLAEDDYSSASACECVKKLTECECVRFGACGTGARLTEALLPVKGHAELAVQRGQV